MSIPTTPEDWLFELKHYKSFNDDLSDLSNPYDRALNTFQIFTRSMIKGLERKDFKALSLVYDGSLRDIYSDLPIFDPKILQSWIKDAILKHPFRRTAKQYQFLAIVQVQSRGDLNSARYISACAAMELEDWKVRVYDPITLVNDPNALYFLRNKNSIKEVDPSQHDVDDTHECLICDNLFDQDIHLMQQAPCRHIVCKECFEKWLMECKGIYTCMLCRACVVCGANDCLNHDVHQDRAYPYPLPRILNLILPDKASKTLHGIKPERYWVLREVTRKDRAMFACIEEMLRASGLGTFDPIHVRLVKDAEEIMARITDAVCEATMEV